MAFPIPRGGIPGSVAGLACRCHQRQSLPVLCGPPFLRFVSCCFLQGFDGPWAVIVWRLHGKELESCSCASRHVVREGKSTGFKFLQPSSDNSRDTRSGWRLIQRRGQHYWDMKVGWNNRRQFLEDLTCVECSASWIYLTTRIGILIFRSVEGISTRQGPKLTLLVNINIAFDACLVIPYSLPLHNYRLLEDTNT